MVETITPAALTWGAFVEVHPRLVDQDDLAVGVDAAGDLRRIGAGDAVQRHRAGGRLAEGDALLAADVEALPVDRGALGGLGDLGVGRGLADRGGAGNHRAPG